MVEKPLPNFLKIFSVDFTIQWWYSCVFLEKKSSKSLNLFPPLSGTGILKTPEKK